MNFMIKKSWYKTIYAKVFFIGMEIVGMASFLSAIVYFLAPFILMMVVYSTMDDWRKEQSENNQTISGVVVNLETKYLDEPRSPDAYLKQCSQVLAEISSLE